MNPQHQPLMTANLLEAYQNDPMVRDRLNQKGLYVNVADNASLTYYLTSNIEDSSEYHDFVEMAICLGQNDTLTLLIDNDGGYLSGAQMIITGLNSTEAETTAVITGGAASAATIIALACDNLVMTEHSYFMIHSVSFGSGGKLHEIASHTEFTIRKSKDLISKIYESFLSPEEIQSVIDGKDFYFDDEETMTRWASVQESRELQIKEAEAEHLKEHIEYLRANLESLEAQLPKEPKPETKTRKKS